MPGVTAAAVVADTMNPPNPTGGSVPGDDVNSAANEATRGTPIVPPQGKWAQTIPAMAEYAGRVAAEHRAALAEFQQQFPKIDVTDTQAFHGALLKQRESLGFELSEDQKLQHSAWLVRMEAMQTAMVVARGQHIGISISGRDERGQAYTLIGFDGVNPVYSFTQNAAAAMTTAANLVRMNPSFDGLVGNRVSGSNLYVNVNDHGEIHEHPEFQWPGGGSRILVKETPWYTGGDRSHMTHVAGTVAAHGYVTNAMGMAPRLWIRALIQQSTSHVTTYGMGYPGQPNRSIMGTTSLGSTDSNSNRCVYTFTSASFDSTLWDYPHYTHFYAAGNAGSGFSTISLNHPIAKNVLTIGSVSDTTRDANGNYVSGGGVSGFSSRGPAYDGRIKPDLCANGDNLYSPSSATGYGNKSGTSMATPNASGSAVLLINYFNQRFPGHFMRSSTTKALYMNTTDDRGNTGPDYTYGWGIVNVHRAAGIVKRYAENPATRVLIEDAILTGQTNAWTYTYDGNGTVRVSLAWIDRPGLGQSTSTATREPRLINNLELRVIDPNGVTHFPYVMPFTIGSGSTPAYDDSLRGSTAVRGTNFTDNAEQVLIANPIAGNYTVQIFPVGTLTGGVQRLSLAVSGMAQTQAVVTTIAAVNPATGSISNALPLNLHGCGFLLGSDVILRRDGFPTAPAFAHQTIGTNINARLDTTGMDKGYWDVVVRRADGAETVLTNGFLLPINSVAGSRVSLHAHSFTNDAGLTLDTGWVVGAPAKSSLGGPGAAYNDTQALCYLLDANYEPNLLPTRWVTFPAVNTLGHTNVQLEFRRWLGIAYNQSGSVSSRHADSARIEWSTNATTWTSLWINNADVTDSSWQLITLTLPASAENKPNLFLRFGIESDDTVESFGWNIDDLKVTGVPTSTTLLPPIFTSVPPAPATATVAQVFSYQVVTSDADTTPDNLALSAATLPAWLNLSSVTNGTGTLTGTPGPGDVTTASIRLTVTDGSYTTHQEFALTVLPVSGNTAPVIQTTTLPDAHVGVSYSAAVSATDADGHPLTLSTGNRPSWLAFTDNGDGTGTFSGTPGAGQNGVETITVTASDGLGSDSKDLSLTVRPRAVVGLSATSYSANETNGQVVITVQRTLNAFGPVTVNYATSNGTAMAGADYTATSGTLNWADGDLNAKTFAVPILNDLFTEGSETFFVRLSGLTGIADSGTAQATVTIVDDDNNTAPQVNILSPAGAFVGLPGRSNTLVVDAAVVDDGQPTNGSLSVAWSQVSGPAAASFANSSITNTTVTFPVDGRYVLRFAAHDGEFSNSVTRTIIVGPVAAPAADTGIAREMFTNITGTAVMNLTTNTKFVANLPDTTGIVTGLFETATSGDNYGQRLRCYFISPQSGPHVFVIASDDSSELWLSSGANSSNKTRVAYTIVATGSRNWSNNVNQTSSNITLMANTPYYVEVLHKEGTGADYAAVGVTLPDATLERPIPGNRLALYQEPAGNNAPLVNPGNTSTAVVGVAFALAGSVTDDGKPSGVLTSLWSRQSGGGAATFADATQPATTVTFDTTGSQVLRLTASDGAATVYQERTVVVVEPSGYEAWIAGYPGVGDLTGPRDDPDGDGLPNLLEFALRLNPAGASLTGLPAAADEAGHLTLTYRQNKDATELTFVVEGRDSLTSGDWATTGIVEVSREDMGGYWLVKVRDGVAINDAPSRFLRLRINASSD